MRDGVGLEAGMAAGERHGGCGGVGTCDGVSAWELSAGVYAWRARGLVGA